MPDHLYFAILPFRHAPPPPANAKSYTLLRGFWGAGHYDAAGNLLNDGTHSYTYDAENNLIKVDSGGTAIYAYDAEGNRAEKITTTGNYSDPAGTWYLSYDQSGRYVLKGNSNYTFVEGQIYAGSRHLASVGGWMTFMHTDWLGNERFRTYMASNPYTYESCTSLPFGDGLNCTGSDVAPHHFTGKERDAATGLDNFGARYNSSSFGRFMSPDPGNAGASPGNPQSWNAYTYVQNNPLTNIDPWGLFCVWDDGSYDSNDDPDTGSFDQCQGPNGAGGTWFYGDPVSNWGLGSDWSSQANGVAAQWAFEINPAGVGLPGPPDSTGVQATADYFETTSASLPNLVACSVSSLSIDNYLSQKQSPMAGQGVNFMNTGQKYNLDPRLLTSIAGAETTFGKNITTGQFNALNVLYNGQNSPFSSFKANINAAGKSLTNPANGYNLSTTSTMYHTYCSGSGCANGLKNLNIFMNQQGANTSSLHFPCP